MLMSFNRPPLCDSGIFETVYVNSHKIKKMDPMLYLREKGLLFAFTTCQQTISMQLRILKRASFYIFTKTLGNIGGTVRKEL